MAIEMLAEGIAKAAEVGAKVAEKTAEASSKAIEQAAKLTEGQLHEIAQQRTIIIQPDMITIKEASLKSLIAANSEGFFQKVAETSACDDESLADIAFLDVDIHADAELAPKLEEVKLSDEQKELIFSETNWPKEIVDCIESMEQYEVYKEANLRYAEIDGRPCLVKDIDMDYIDAKTGFTNRELLEKGRPPIDAKTGERIELHHMGQDFNSPFAELCENSEHGDGKDSILHDKNLESWRRDPAKQNEYNNHQRPNHWKARATEV